MPRSSRLALLLIAACLSGSHGSAQSGADYTEVVQGVPFVMKAIPAGTFQQGCGEADEPCIEEEWVDYEAGIRQQSVSVAAFYLAETETTWALYQRCIDAGACPDNTADGGDNGWGKGTRPAIEMSWNDITTAFLPWLNRETGGAYRLPTEAEWEKSALGASLKCNHSRLVGHTTPVNAYSDTSKHGCQDMLGNVWEWTSSWFYGYPDFANYPYPGYSKVYFDGEHKVLKGGSFATGSLRTSFRNWYHPHVRQILAGFRCVKD